MAPCTACQLSCPVQKMQIQFLRRGEGEKEEGGWREWRDWRRQGGSSGVSLSYGRGVIRRVTGWGVDNPLVICLVL